MHLPGLRLGSATTSRQELRQQRPLNGTLCIIAETMKRLLFKILFLVPIILIGQEKESNERKLSIGLNFSPNYSYRTLSYDEEWEGFVETREEQEHPSFAFNTGIAVHYSVNENVELVANVQFSKQTHSFKEVPIADAMGGNTGGFADIQLRYYYLEIPFRANYLFLKGKIFGYATAGASLNLFLNDETKSWLTYANGEEETRNSDTGIQDFNKTAIGLIGGLGFGYNLNEKWDVRMEPIFRYSLTPLAEAPIDQFNYSIGCQFGVNMKI